MRLRVTVAMILLTTIVAFGAWIWYLNYVGLIDRPLAVTLMVTEVPIGLLLAFLTQRIPHPSEQKTTSNETPPEKTSQSTAQDTFQLEVVEPKLRANLQLGYKNLLKQDLIEIRSRLYTPPPKNILFHVWNAPAANTKRQLLDDEILYNAVEDFSTTLNERNNRLKKSDPTFPAWNQLCIKHYDKFREIGFMS